MHSKDPYWNCVFAYSDRSNVAFLTMDVMALKGIIDTFLMYWLKQWDA